MDPNPTNHRSTRLENLRFESGAARFDLGGQSVHLRQEADPASFAALESVYRSALADYRERHEGPRRPGLFARLISWVGRLFQEPRTGNLAPPAPPSPPLSPREPPEHRARMPPIRDPAPAPQAYPSVSNAPRRHPAAEAPLLRAIFADPEGVHLTWHPGDGRGSGREHAESTCRLDSEVARSLQSCYENLGRLGYKVVGLDLLCARPDASEKSPGHVETRPAHPPLQAPRPEPVLPAAASAAPAPSDRSAAVRKEPSLVVRLIPGTGEEPGRAMVSPVETPENAQSLAAPERLVGALRAASEPGVPEKDRVTYLRCAVGKGGFKVVDVGLGEGKNHGPEQWVEVSAWSARGPALESAAKKPRTAPAVAKPGPQAGSFVLRVISNR